ncbi:hypothetical protein ACFT2C_04235 [Promicromonospora sp. NPDC057138]|uniref:hypothetical protein n=1 Tax=Promicromonospora sp. NPDC057138 TaxID=3346031 RepID=UPI00363D6D99
MSVVVAAAALALFAACGFGSPTAVTTDDVREQCSDTEGWDEFVTVTESSVTISATDAEMEAHMAEKVDACVGYATGAPKDEIVDAFSSEPGPTFEYEWDGRTVQGAGWKLNMSRDASGMIIRYSPTAR